MATTRVVDAIRRWSTCPLAHRAVTFGVPPLAPGQLPLGRGVELPIDGVGAQPVPERQVPRDGRVVGAIAVQVHRPVGLPGAQAPVTGLGHPQRVPDRFQVGQVRGLVIGIIDADDDVDNGLGHQPRHRCRPDVLDEQRPRPEHRPQLGGTCLEPSWPGRIWLRERHTDGNEAIYELGDQFGNVESHRLSSRGCGGPLPHSTQDLLE